MQERAVPAPTKSDIRQYEAHWPGHGWPVIRDVIVNYWPRLLLVGALSGIFAVSQGVLVALVMLSVDAGHAFPAPVQSVLAWMGNEIFLGFPLMVLLLGSFSALTMLQAMRIAVGMMVRYERHCVERLIRRLQPEREKLASYDDAQILQLLTKDCRYGGRIAFELTTAVFPSVISLIALPLLFYLNVFATLTLMIVIAVLIRIQAALWLRARQVSKNMEDHAPLDKTSKAKVLKALRAMKDGEPLAKCPPVPDPRFLETYRQRLLMPHVGNTFGAFQAATALAVAVFWFTSMGADGADASSLVLYLAVAFFVMQQLRNVSKVFVNFHVFYTYFRRVFFVMRDGLEALPSTQSTDAEDQDEEKDLTGVQGDLAEVL